MKRLTLGWMACVAAVTGWGCAQDAGNEPMSTDDAAVVAALAQGEDGADEDMADATDAAPELQRECGLGSLRKHIVATYDTNNDGTLDENEREALGQDFDGSPRRIVRKHGMRGHVMRQHRLRLVHWLYDANSDGQLDTAERAELTADLETRCENRKASLLARFDANMDGQLDDAEWQAAGQDLAARFAKRRAAVLASFDTNDDGQLDLAERYDARMAIHDRVDGRRDALKQEYDTDHSGSLDADEELALREDLKARVRGEQFAMP